ncbi:MAG: excinuclease ABC subunit UvrC [Clostridiales bacterium]|nr:excinuclease ABC subunit UvrC [Clostridiales bacterium]
MNDIIQAKLKLLPSLPGVYQMLDEAGEVIYIGKAVSLKNRVRQYFQSGKAQAPNVRALVRHIADFETIVVGNEMEAFSLERNLIRQYKPKYNILLKDDKHFPYVRIDFKQDFPRVEVVRQIAADGATYLGPYLSALTLRDELTLIRDHFPIRHCKKDISRAIARRERPCLMSHVKKCCAPCSGLISREIYHGYLKEITRFLNGNTKEILAECEEKMLAASEDLDFETAAALRDRMAAIVSLSKKQVAITTHNLNADVFAPALLGGESLVYALFVRNGKIIGTEPFFMAGSEGDSADAVLAAFLPQFYGEETLPPGEILLACGIGERENLESFLSEQAGRRVHISVPQRGEKRRLVELASDNGKKVLEKRFAIRERAWERDEGALLRLGELLGINGPLTRLECFDNSHTMGWDTVSSMVVFVHGKPEKSAYRRFRVRGETHGDDLLAMREILRRRFERGGPWPDLLIVDGGKTQLNAALDVLREFGLVFPAIGLAEEQEIIYAWNRAEPIVLPRNDATLHLLMRIRDEAHRFAITYHRSVRQRNALFSVLDGIPGVGEKRKRALFDAFVTLDAIKKATPAELAAVKGMNASCAEAVFQYFKA